LQKEKGQRERTRGSAQRKKREMME
jgi:hypothetical protein